MTTTLHEHDLARLTTLADRYPNETALSFEGQPLYGHEPWGPMHEFSYGLVIPTIAGLTALKGAELNVLFDDFTPDAAELPYTSDYFLDAIAANVQHNLGRSHELGITVQSERDMNETASVWIDGLNSAGLTVQEDHITSLTLEGQRPIRLTTASGRPSCAVLDAVFQTSKAERGLTDAVLVHSTAFRGQQRDMRAVLGAVHGELPFNSFTNVFIRERKGLGRLSLISIYGPSGQGTELK